MLSGATACVFVCGALWLRCRTLSQVESTDLIDHLASKYIAWLPLMNYFFVPYDWRHEKQMAHGFAKPALRMMNPSFDSVITMPRVQWLKLMNWIHRMAHFADEILPCRYFSHLDSLLSSLSIFDTEATKCEFSIQKIAHAHSIIQLVVVAWISMCNANTNLAHFCESFLTMNYPWFSYSVFLKPFDQCCLWYF